MANNLMIVNLCYFFIINCATQDCVTHIWGHSGLRDREIFSYYHLGCANAIVCSLGQDYTRGGGGAPSGDPCSQTKLKTRCPRLASINICLPFTSTIVFINKIAFTDILFMK